MKKIQIIILMMISFVSNSQSFAFKKVLIDNNLINIKGSIDISNEDLKINTNGQINIYKINSIYDTESLKKYKVANLENTDTEIRITLTDENSSKKEKKILVLEIKDNFTNKLTTMTYFLSPI